jgi:sugar (pentulose or hexulose) kinase
MAVAVLDVGKTNVKIVLFDGPAAVWQRSAPNRIVPGPPYPHADVEAIWRFFLDALREAASVHPIGTIVVATHGATAALVDGEGLVLPVMDYEFAGVDAIEPVYAPLRPPFGETLSPPLSAGLTIGRQLVYQETHHPAAFARAQAILMYAQYFAWRLSGVAATEVTSIGCHADLWRPAEGRPSSLVAERGWDRLLPPLAAAFDRLGPILPAIAAATGLDPTVAILAGIHDSNASLLPHLAALPAPFTLVSTGTWVVIMAVGAASATLDPARDMLAYVDVTGRPVPAAKFMGGREFAAILAGDAPDADAGDLAAVLASGTMALPSFAPNGGPFPGRAGSVEGRLPDRPGARAALASLYAALVTDWFLDALGAAAGPIAIEGSFAANRLYGAVLAALRPGQSVMASADAAGTAYGASLLASWPSPPAGHPLRPVAPLPDALALRDHARAWRVAVGG